MLRGEIWIVDFEPTTGSEANKRRPAVIVSNDAANRSVAAAGRGVLTVVPLSSNVHRVLRFQVLVPSSVSGLRADSKAQTEQLRSLSPERLSRRIGRVPEDLMNRIEGGIRMHLDL